MPHGKKRIVTNRRARFNAVLRLGLLVLLAAVLLATGLAWSRAHSGKGALGPIGKACRACRMPLTTPRGIVALSSRDLTPWPAMLTETEVQRAQAYYGTGSSIRRVAAKLLAGKPISVVVLGGSITYGMGASQPEYSYASRFFKILNTSFPHSNHSFVNKAIPASTSTIFAVCFDKLVPPEVDLAIVEFTYNDLDGHLFSSPGRRAYEQLLRRFFKFRRMPAVIMLHYYAWWFTFGDGIKKGLYYKQIEPNLQVFANYYDMPSVSMRTVLWPLMSAGVEGFKPNKLLEPASKRPKFQHIPQALPGEEEDYFYQGRMHPSDQGHQVIAEALTGPLVRAIKEEALGRLGIRAYNDRRQDPRLDGLLPPMIPGNKVPSIQLCSMQEDFQQAVKAFSGFEWRPERPNATTFLEQKWGWTGLNPGDWAEVVVDTRGDPQHVGPRPRLQTVSLMYLRSYEHMGTARVECTANCRCNSTRLDASWERTVSLLQMHTFSASRHEVCTIRVTITPEAGIRPSGEHKVTLMGVVDGMLTQEGKTGVMMGNDEVQAAFMQQMGT